MSHNQRSLDIVAMCNTARQCVRIAIEWAGDDAKDALMLRSARYNRAHGLPLSSAHQVALAAEVRKTLSGDDRRGRSDGDGGRSHGGGPLV